MNTRHRSASITGLLLAGLAALMTACATPDAPWPERAVSIDRMRLLTAVRAKVIIKDKDHDKSLTTTVVLHLHVDAQGQTVRARIAQPSGNPRADEAALLSMRTARFAPWLVDGVAQPVTVVAPMHFPFQDRKP